MFGSLLISIYVVRVFTADSSSLLTIFMVNSNGPHQAVSETQSRQVLRSGLDEY